MATNQQLIAEALRKKYNKEKEENKEKEDLNFWQKAMLGYTQAVGNLQENASNAMEGLFIDAPVSLIGSGLDLVGLDDAAQKLYDFRERNLIQEWMQNGTVDKIKGGIANSLPSGKFVGNVANFLTSTKPAEIASKFTGISNEQIKQAYVGQDANYLPEIVDVLSNQAGNLIGLYAAGNVGGAFGNVGRNLAVGGAVGGKSAEQASLEGASGLEATGYGILSGVIEAGTEQLMNGISSKLFGNGGKFLGISGNNVVKGGGSGLGTALLRIGRNFTEEGLEEVVSELANPIAQMLTYRRGSTYGELFEEQGGLEAVGQAFVLGGLMGGVMETGQTALGSLEMKSLKAYNFVRETESIIELNGKIKEALANGDQLEYAELMNDKQAEINRIKRKYDKFLNDIESGKINTQQILQAVDSFEYQQNIDARQSLGQDIASGILGNDITVQLSQDENLKGSNYDPSTKTITLKDNQVNVSNFQQILMHEIGHAVKSSELSQELINGIDESSYNKMFEETKTKYADEIKGMTEEQAKAYIDEEIAGDVLGDMFENTNDFLRSVNELNARGLSRLINYIKQAFKHKPKPKNYRRIMEVLDEAELKTEGEIRNKFSEKKDIDSNIKRIYQEMKDFIRTSSYIKEDRPERIYPKIQTSLNVLTKFAFGEKTSFKANKESLEALQTDDLNYLNNLLVEYLSLPPEKGEPGGLIYDVIQEINKIKNPIDKNINISTFFEYLSDLNQALNQLIYEFLDTGGDRASVEVSESKLLEFSKKAKDIYIIKDIIVDCWNKSYSNKKIIAKNKELSLEWNKKDEEWKENKRNNDSLLSVALSTHKKIEEAINKSIEGHEKNIAIQEKNAETATEVKQEPVKEEAETTKEVEQEPIKEPRIKYDKNKKANFNIDLPIIDESYRLKGTDFLDEMQADLLTLEEQRNSNAIDEQKYEEKRSLIDEKIVKESNFVGEALSAVNKIDLNNIKEDDFIPKKRQLENLYAYAKRMEQTLQEIGYDNFKYTQLNDDANFYNVYDYVKENNVVEKSTKPTPKVEKPIEIPKEEIKVTPKVVEEIKPTEEVKQDVEQKVETQETKVVEQKPIEEKPIEQKPIEEKQVKEKKPRKPKLEKLHNEVMNIAASIDKRVAEITRNIEAGENSQTSANEKFDDLKAKYAEKSKKFQKEIIDIANKLGDNATKEQKKLGKEIVDAVNKMTEQFKDIKYKLDKFNKDIAKKKKQASKPKPKVEKPIEVPKEVVKPKPKVVENTENVAKEVKEEPKNVEKKDKTEQTKVDKKETPKKDNEVKQLDKALKRLETEQDVTKITKTIDGEIKTIYIANRAKSIPDNAKTVKLAAELFNEKVYTKTSAKDIIDSARKYVTERREAGLVFEGEGQEWAQNDIFVIMNELDSVKTKEAKIDEITEYLVSKLNKEIRDDNHVKATIRTKVAEVMETKGKQSERSKLLEKQQKDFNKEIAKLTTELTKSQQEIEELRYELGFAELQLSEALENKDVNGKEVELALKMAIKAEEKFNKLQDKSSKRIADLKEKLKEKRLLASYLKSEVKRLKISLETHKEKYKEVYKDLKKNITFYDKLMKKKKTIIENSKSKKPVYHPKIGALILELPNFLTRDSINVGGKATRVKFVELKEQLDAIREEIYNDTGLRPSAELTDALDKINEIYKKSQTPDANNKLHNIPVKGTEIELYYTVVNELMNFGMDARKERTFNVKGYENREIKGTKKEIMQNAKTDIERAQKVTKGFKQKKGILKTLTNVTSPRIFFKLLDGYNPNGIMTTFYDSLRMKEAQKMKKQNEYEKGIVDFLKKNSKFTKTLRKEVTINGKKAKVAEFVELYNLFQQKDSAKILSDEKAIIKFGGEVYSSLTLDELNKLKKEVAEYLNNIEGFKEFDKLVVEMLEKCREDKITTDNDRIGRTNVLAKGERYYPIYAIQELRHQTFDKDGNIQFLCAKDLSFNKSRTEKNMTIEVHDCLNTLLTYTKGMAFYTTCYTEVENMQSILQSHIEPGISYIGRLNDVLATEKNPRFVIEYLTEFFANYQGYKRDVNWFTQLKRRSSAYYVAGNINSIIRQATSYWAASRYINVFDPKVTLRLYAHKIKQFDDYMPDSIKYRDTDSIMMVQGDFNRNVFDKTSEKLFAITSAVDKWQVELIWRAALIQCGVHEKGISDVERMERVGKAQELADLAVRETQDNTMVTESSRLSQKQDAISQSLTQFRSQPTQMFTTLVDSYLNVYAKKKNGDEITKKDVANIFKASYGVVVSQAMGVAIAMLLKGALDRDEEVKDPKAWANQFAQELIGIIPVIGNFAHITFNGFDTADGKSAIEFGTYDFSVGPISLFMESISQFAEAFNDFSNFDGRFDHNNFVDALAKYTGLPYGSASRLVKGVFNWVDSEFATKFGIEYTGQKISQKTQINSAIGKGNYSQAKAYYRIYTNGIVELDESVISVMFDAYKNGETTSTLRPIPKTITYENEAYEVDTKAFEKEYGRVKKPLLQLSNDKTFKSMDYEEQAQCISKLSNLYYELAKNKVVGNELKPLHYLASSDYNLSKDIVHLVKISNMSSTSNKTKKEQVQEYLKKLNIPYAEKLLISYLTGYKLDNASINKVKLYLKQNMVPYKTIEKMFEEK